MRESLPKVSNSVHAEFQFIIDRIGSWDSNTSPKTALCDCYCFECLICPSPMDRDFNAVAASFCAHFPNSEIRLQAVASLGGDLQGRTNAHFLVTDKGGTQRLYEWMKSYKELRLNSIQKEFELLSHVPLSHKELIGILLGLERTLVDELGHVHKKAVFCRDAYSYEGRPMTMHFEESFDIRKVLDDPDVLLDGDFAISWTRG